MFSHQKMNLILEPSEGLGGVWLGDIDAATDLKHLEKHNVTAVLTAAAGTRISYRKEAVREHFIINADDVESFQLSRFFEKGVDFIDKCRKAGLNILIHCFAGISRSTTMTIAYMIKKLGFSYLKAHDHIKARRRIICPNNGFKAQLREYERKCRASDKETGDSSVKSPLSPAKDVKDQTAMQKTAHNILNSKPTATVSFALQPPAGPGQTGAFGSKTMTVPTPFSIMGVGAKSTTATSTQYVGGVATLHKPSTVVSSSAAREGPKVARTEPTAYAPIAGRTHSVAAGGTKYLSAGPVRLTGTMTASGVHSTKEQTNFLRITAQNDNKYGIGPRKKLF